MTLGAPDALWWLLLTPLVVLLYMLRARREPRPVSSVLLWERATRDLVARLPMRRLERSLLLLLQVLAIGVIVLALARPSVALRGLAADAAVLVIDTSASMQATDVAPNRLAAAQQEALGVLSRLGPRQPAAVVAAGPRPRLVADFTTDHSALAAAVRRLQPTDAGAAVPEAVALASSLRAGGRPGVVHLFSDRAPPQAGVTWHRIGRGAPNAAITAARTRLDARGRTQLMLRLEAFGGSFPSRTLTVTVNGRRFDQRQVHLVPDAPQTMMLDLGDVSGIATASLQGGDALAADDRAVAAVGREGLPRVLVVGEPNPVLDAALQAIPTSGVARTDQVFPDQWGHAAVVVVDRMPLPLLPPGSYLLIGTLGGDLPVQVLGTVHDQTVRAVAATHPAMRLTDLRGVRIATALALRTQGGIALAESDVPVVWAYEGRGVRALVLAFDLAQSDLPLHPAFPVLVANAIDWLGGGSQARLGEAPLVPAGIWKQAILRRPDGGAVTIEARDGAFALPVLDRIGDYHLRTEGWERRWVVSTVEAHESSLDPDPPASTSAAPSVPQMAQISLVPWLLGAAALLLAGEWWLWARTLPVRQRDGGAR